MKKSKVIKILSGQLCHASALTASQKLKNHELVGRISFLEYRNKELEDQLAKQSEEIAIEMKSRIRDAETIKKELARAMELLKRTTQLDEAIRLIEKVYNAI